VQIRAIPPPEMVANLRAGNIDGFLAPDPVNQRAVYDGVAFIHTLSKEIWDRHPCCAFAASKEFITANPNTYAALLKSIIEATAFAARPENRKQIAEAIAPANYLNQPVTVVEQVLTEGLPTASATSKTCRTASISIRFRGSLLRCGS
jgi:nitrate/nitrite transport system substrate-binding protein